MVRSARGKTTSRGLEGSKSDNIAIRHCRNDMHYDPQRQAFCSIHVDVVQS